MASEPLPVEDLERVIEASEEAQRQFGDCFPQTVECKLPEMGSFDFKQNNLIGLSKIWFSWSNERRHQFNEKYGHIAYLIFIEVEKPLLKAMIRFWDPPYRCFTFNEMDMTLTIEEYATLLNTLSTASDRVYVYKHKQKFKKNLAKIMGIHADKITLAMKEKGESTCVSWDFLHTFIQDHPDDKEGMSVMALAIYGLVIFPKVKGYVDGMVINFFEQVEHKVNPVPAILAETFRSLNFCRNQGKGRFIGCAQLLYIWMKSHFACLENKFGNVFRMDKLPIYDFYSSKWPESLRTDVWVEIFRNLTSREIVWVAPWMLREYALYRCGKFPWVPLLGPWGGIGHAPTMVRKQLGSKQFIPEIRDLSQSEFSYGDKATTNLVTDMVNAWKEARRVKPGRYTDDVTIGYRSWQASRRKGFTPPQAIKDHYTVMEARHKLATNEMQIENVTLTLENQRLQDELEEWKDQTKRAKKRVRQLDRYIDSIIIKKGRVEKENEKLRDTAERLTKNVKKFDEGIKALQVDLNLRIMERDEAVMMNHDLQSSMIDLNHEILMQQKRIQALRTECERLEMYSQDIDSFRNGCGLLYSQAECFTLELKNVAEKARKMAERTKLLRNEVIPDHAYGQRLILFLDDLHRQLVHVGMFF